MRMRSSDTMRPRRPAPVLRTVEVRSTERLTPHMIRVRLGGEELAGFEIAGPTGHIKIFLPQPGQDGIDFEALRAPRGEKPPSAPIARTFTPRRFDAKAQLLDVDFYVHGDGPAATFAKNAAPGQVIAISGPSRPHHLRPEAFQLIAGDETAFPAIAMILESLPAEARGLVILELGDEADRPEFEVPAGVTVTTALRLGEPGAAMVTALEKAVEELPSPVQAWVAGESVAIRRARVLLLASSLGRDDLTTRGYWRLGAAGHPDHDMGED